MQTVVAQELKYNIQHHSTLHKLVRFTVADKLSYFNNCTFSAETTGQIFIKILHDVVALGALLNHAYTRRYPIPFLNARATKVRSLPFFHKIDCHRNVP